MSTTFLAEANEVTQYERSVSIERTERGLVFIMLGALVCAFPIIRPAGAVMGLTGAVWFVLGRDPFGDKHSRNAILAAAISIVGLSLVLVGSIGYVLFVLSIPHDSFPTYDWGNDLFAWALVASLKSLLTFEAAGAILTGIAYTLFPYSLQKPAILGRGRELARHGWKSQLPSKTQLTLLGALAITILVSVLVFSVLTSDLTSQLIPDTRNLLSAYSPGNANPDVAHAFEGQVLTVSLLSLLPAVIYLAAYRSIYSLVKRGQIVTLRLQLPVHTSMPESSPMNRKPN